MLVRSDGEDRSEIAFFDVETTVPSRPGQGHSILEFGAILVCPRKLVELRHYSTLVRPVDLSHISTLSVRSSGITRDAVLSAQSFSEIADVVYDILHGRIWAGHNILRFDCARIREAFAEIKKPAPEPKGTIDSLALLTQKFGRRAGDMKMASLATYFGLGRQTHRSLDDVRMNLEILKYCATVLFLESSLPDIFTEKSWISPNATTRSRSNGKKSTDQIEPGKLRPTSTINAENVPTSSPSHHTTSENHPILSLMTPNVGPFDMTSLGSEIERDFLPKNKTEDENTSSSSEEPPSSSVNFKGHSDSTNDFLEPHDISIDSISTTLVPFYRGTQKTQILHKNIPLLLRCDHLKVRFGISRKFVDHAGRPRLSIVVNASRDLCNILDAIDELAQKRSIDSGSLSEWRPIVIRNPGYYNFPTIRLHLPTMSDGEAMRVLTEIYHKDDTSTLQRLVFSGFDAVELDSLFTTGNFVDAFFSFDAYDYQQSAGIRLVAKKLVVYS